MMKASLTAIPKRIRRLSRSTLKRWSRNLSLSGSHTLIVLPRSENSGMRTSAWMFGANRLGLLGMLLI